MNKRKRKRAMRRLSRKKMRYLSALQTQEIITSMVKDDLAWGRLIRDMSNDPTVKPFFGKPVERVPARGRIPWYDQAIKQCYEYIEKICKNRGFYGEDKYMRSSAPVPSEIKEYLEDEEIDFGLRENGE